MLHLVFKLIKIDMSEKKKNCRPTMTPGVTLPRVRHRQRGDAPQF
jgi:hypothetical protein